MLVKYMYETATCKTFGRYLCEWEDFLKFFKNRVAVENSDILWFIVELKNGYGYEYHCWWNRPVKIVWKKSLAPDFDDFFGVLREEF